MAQDLHRAHRCGRSSIRYEIEINLALCLRRKVRCDVLVDIAVRLDIRSFARLNPAHLRTRFRACNAVQGGALGKSYGRLDVRVYVMLECQEAYIDGRCARGGIIGGIACGKITFFQV